MARKNRTQFGKLTPKYNFSLSPYSNLRFSKCPICEGKTDQRKLPLLTHIHPDQLISLNYTHRYCSNCDLLIGHKHEIEHHLTTLFSELNPDDIGNDYIIIGTVEKKTWRAGLKQPQMINETIDNTHDFKNYNDLHVTMIGWFRNDQIPPVLPPTPSTEWVK